MRPNQQRWDLVLDTTQDPGSLFGRLSRDRHDR